MFDFKVANPELIYLTPEFNLGQRAWAHDGREYVFCKIDGEDNQVDHRMCYYNENYEGRATVADELHTGLRVGLKDNPDMIPGGREAYMWLLIYGVGTVFAASNTDAHADIYTADQWGRVGDSSTNQHRLRNIYTLEDIGGHEGIHPLHPLLPARIGEQYGC